MRVAVLGAGRIGCAHARTLHGLAGVTDLVVADLDRDRASHLAQDLATEGRGPAVRAASVDKVYASSPDALVVAVATPGHAEHVLRAVTAGIPVFCEKPLAETLAATTAVVAEVERQAVPVQIGFQRRFDAGYAAARQALATGAIGGLRRVHMLTCDPAPPPPEFIPTSGGIYRDCHVHDFDVLRWVTGREVTSVFATGANRGADFFAAAGDVDESAALLTMDDGTLVTLQGSRYNGAGYDVRLELAGTLGNRCVGLDDRAPLTSAEPRVGFPAGRPWANFQERFAAAYTAELAAFLRVAEGSLASPCTPRDALETLLVAEAAEVSVRERRVVQVDDLRAPTASTHAPAAAAAP